MTNGFDGPPPVTAGTPDERMAFIAKGWVSRILELVVYEAIYAEPDTFGLDKNFSEFDAQAVACEEINKPWVHDKVRGWLERDLFNGREPDPEYTLPFPWPEMVRAMLSFLRPASRGPVH